jgi:starvation-inducible DNA-binding protein
MSKPHAQIEHPLFDGQTTRDLVALLNQSLAETLDLAYQTKQAHWNVKGRNFYSLHLLFDQLHGQLLSYVNDLAERAVTLGGQAHGTIRAATSATRLNEYPLEARASHIHLDALVDRYGEYTSRIRKAVREADRLNDKDTADLYISVSRAMDKALWMLTAHHEA